MDSISKKCSIQGCDGLGSLEKNGKRYLRRGYCSLHYWKWRKYGSPLIVRQVSKGIPLAYFNKMILEETDDCINWIYANINGYGQLYLKGNLKSICRLALERRVGESPSGKPLALHKPVICHNPACFNYRHLYWGDFADNEADKILDGTSNRGEGSGVAKFTTMQVLQIHTDTRPNKVIAREYNVFPQTIGNIRRGKTWSDVTKF